MKKSTMKILAACLMLALPVTVVAQASPEEELGKIEVRVPEMLFLPTKPAVNIRMSPSLKGERVYAYGEPVTLYGQFLREGFGMVNGWFKMEFNGCECYMSGTVARKSVSGPIKPEMMNTMQAGICAGYDDYSTWRVAVHNPTTKVALCETEQEGDGHFHKLRLGKLVNNVFIFRYAVDVNITYSEGIKGCNVERKVLDEYGNCVYNITFGDDNALALEDTGVIVLDLTKISSSALLKIFEKQIEEECADYYYINSEMLSAPYANCIPG